MKTEIEKLRAKKVRRIMRLADKYADKIQASCGHESLLAKAFDVRDVLQIEVEALVSEELHQ